MYYGILDRNDANSKCIRDHNFLAGFSFLLWLGPILARDSECSRRIRAKTCKQTNKAQTKRAEQEIFIITIKIKMRTPDSLRMVAVPAEGAVTKVNNIRETFMK